MEENRRKYRNLLEQVQEIKKKNHDNLDSIIFNIYEEAVQCAKSIYIETGLLKDKVILIEAYMNKARIEEQIAISTKNNNELENSYLTYKRAKRLIDELLEKNKQIQYQRLFVNCVSNLIRVSICLNKKKNARQLIGSVYLFAKKIYRQTELVDDLKPLMYVYYLIGDWFFTFSYKFIARFWYQKVLKRMSELYQSMHDLGMKYDIIDLYKKIIMTYNKDSQGKKNWEIKCENFKEKSHDRI